MVLGAFLIIPAPDQASIRDTYAERELPPQVATLIGNMTQCPNTRKMTSQEDNNQVFLIPIGYATHWDSQGIKSWLSVVIPSGIRFYFFPFHAPIPSWE